MELKSILEKAKAVAYYILRYVLSWVVIAWLIYELTQIGWVNIYQQLPTNFWFYVIVLLSYFQLPLFEYHIFRKYWGIGFWHSFPAFVKKRIFNKEVFGYSGEAFFLSWASSNSSKSEKEILLFLKDNAIISSFASTIFSVVLLITYIYFSGSLDLITVIETANISYGLIIAGLVIISIVAYRFRKLILTLPKKDAIYIFGVQSVRLVFVQILNLSLFLIVLPQIPIFEWLNYLAVEIIISRIPLLPSKDFLYVGVSSELTNFLELGQAAIVALLLSRTIIQRGVSLGLLLLFKLRGE